MLTALREGTKSWVAAIFIFVIAASFAVWGIGDWIGGALQADVATIGNKKVSQADFRRVYDREIQNMQRQYGRVIQREQARLLGVDQRVLSTLLGTAALELHGDELKLGITEDAIAERIKRDPAFQGVGTNEFDPERLRQTLQFSGITEGAFVDQQRQGLLREQLTQTIGTDITVPKTLLTALNTYQNEVRAVDYVIVTPEQAGKIAEPTSTQLETYYKDNERQFTAPEYRKIAAIVLKPESFREGISVTDDDIKESYSARDREFNTPEKRTVEQITFADEAAAKKAHDELKAGKTFDKLADEQGREDRFISYGSVAASGGIFDAEISKAAFALKEPGFTEPVKGALSTAIVRVTKIEPANTKTLESVKEQVRTDLINERAITKVADLFDKIEDDRAKGLSLEDISSKRDVDLIQVPAMDAEGKAPDGTVIASLPANAIFRRNVFAAEVDLQADAVELGQESFAFLEVLELTAEKVRPFKDVAEDVKTAWNTAETRRAVATYATKLVEKIDAGTTFADVAKEASLEVKTADDLKRASRTDDLPSAAVGRIFTLGQGKAASAELLGGTQRTVFALKKITQPDAPTDEQATAITNGVSSQLGTEMVTQYLLDLQSRYAVEINQEAIAAATDPAGPAGGRGSF